MGIENGSVPEEISAQTGEDSYTEEEIAQDIIGNIFKGAQDILEISGVPLKKGDSLRSEGFTAETDWIEFTGPLHMVEVWFLEEKAGKRYRLTSLHERDGNMWFNAVVLGPHAVWEGRRRVKSLYKLAKKDELITAIARQLRP